MPFMDINTFHANHGIKADPIVRSGLLTTGAIDYEGTWGDQEALSKVYENLETVYRCITFRAENLTKVKIRFFKQTPLQEEKTEVTDDPIFDILTRRPNPFQTSHEFRYEYFTRLDIQGESFWHMLLNTKGMPVEMYGDWRSSEVQILRDSKHMVSKYILNRNGKEFEIAPEEVFFQKYFNPYDTIRGLAPMRAARHSITLDLNAIGFNKNFFKQGMKMGGVLELPEEPKENEAKRLKASFDKMYGGNDKMHQTGIIWGGMKFTPISDMGLNDAQFLELRQMNKQDIITVFGLFPELFGMGRTTFQNVKYYRRMAWTETLQPIMNKFIDVLNNKFLPFLTNDPYIFAEPDYSNIEALKEDRSQKVKDYDIGMKHKVISRNEMRVDVYNKEPVDNEEWNDPEFNVNQTGSTPTDSETPEKSIRNWTYSKGIYSNVKTANDRTQIWHQEIKGLKADEDLFHRRIVTYFNDQKHRILDAVDKYVAKKNLKIRLTSENVLFDIEAEKTILFEKGTPWIFEVFKKVADNLARQIQSGKIDYEVPSVRQALGQRVLKFSTFVNNETDKQIKKVIKKVFEENVGSEISVLRDKLKEGISDLYENFTETRADLIARTEVVGARNMGLQEGMIQSKVANKMWITSRDDRVRDTHQIDGAVVGVNSHFTLADGSQMFYPNDFNERCVIIATNEEVNQL